MNRGSLRLRLWSTAAISLIFALAAAGLGLVYLFELHVERRIETELSALLNQLIAATQFNGDRLEVHCTDPLATIDIPNLISETGDRIENTSRDGDRIIFLIERRIGPVGDLAL